MVVKNATRQTAVGKGIPSNISGCQGYPQQYQWLSRVSPAISVVVKDVLKQCQWLSNMPPKGCPLPKMSISISMVVKDDHHQHPEYQWLIRIQTSNISGCQGYPQQYQWLSRASPAISLVVKDAPSSISGCQGCPQQHQWLSNMPLNDYHLPRMSLAISVIVKDNRHQHPEYQRLIRIPTSNISGCQRIQRNKQHLVNVLVFCVYT